MILSLVLLNLAGGDCISDIERLEQDAGLRTLLMQFATHGMKRKERGAFEKRWRKTKSRVEGDAFIPKPNDKLSASAVPAS